MKKCIVIVTVLVLLSIVVFAGKKGDRNATGLITSLEVSSPVFEVQGITENGKLWLGYTVCWYDGVERDYDPIRVKDRFSKTLTFALRPQGLKEVIVCLWRYRVSKSQCAKDNGGHACEWCRKNGYHMEGRIDCESDS